MAEHAQIDIRKGNTVVRIHSGWGIPKMVFAALREVAATERKTPQAIAKEFIRRYEDGSFGLDIIEKDFQRDALSFYYTVDVSTTPWKVVQESCPVHKFTKKATEEFKKAGFIQVTPDMLEPTLTPSRLRTIRIKAKATVAGK